MLNCWYYPKELANDLQDVGMAKRVKEEIFACAWEYTRCVIPQYTNWSRYISFTRTIIISIVAEFRGDLVDVVTGDIFLGYNLSETLANLFEGTPNHASMAREYRSSLLITADKSSTRRNGELFRRYVNALAQSPRQWFRMRDADALARFTIAAALACNDHDRVSFTDEQFEILTEIGDTLYDAVAFFKHRAEGETNSTFAYVPSHLREKAFHQCREILWALDVAWAQESRPRVVVINFIRFFSGPIHMMMRRYRFVEEGLVIGKRETDQVINETRRGVKLWHRVECTNRSDQSFKGIRRYEEARARSEELMFFGLAEFLETNRDLFCVHCQYRDSYGAEVHHQFGGVRLCQACEGSFQRYVESLPTRAEKVFPELSRLKPELYTQG